MFIFTFFELNSPLYIAYKIIFVIISLGFALFDRNGASWRGRSGKGYAALCEKLTSDPGDLVVDATAGEMSLCFAGTRKVACLLSTGKRMFIFWRIALKDESEGGYGFNFDLPGNLMKGVCKRARKAVLSMILGYNLFKNMNYSLQG